MKRKQKPTTEPQQPHPKPAPGNFKLAANLSGFMPLSDNMTDAEVEAHRARLNVKAFCAMLVAERVERYQSHPAEDKPE